MRSGSTLIEWAQRPRRRSTSSRSTRCGSKTLCQPWSISRASRVRVAARSARSSAWSARRIKAGVCGISNTRRSTPLALKVFDQIAGEAADEWPGTTLAIHHRVGRLGIGEASVVIVGGRGASGGGVCGVPVRDRARQADRAGLEARVLRRRRRVGRRRGGRSGRRAGAAGGAGAGMRVTVQLFARLRELAGRSELGRAMCRRPPRSPTSGAALVAALSGARGLRRSRCRRAVNAEFARMTATLSATATRSRFCRRCPAADATRTLLSGSVGI